MPGDKEEPGRIGDGGQRRKEETKELRKTAEGKEEIGKADKGVRRGRPTNVEALKREKSLSTGNMPSIEKIWKRKRGADQGEEEGGERGAGDPTQVEGWIFRESNLIERSPERKKEKTEEEGGIGELKEMMKKLGEGQKELGERIEASTRTLGIEMREEIAGIKGEIGKIKEEMKEREDNWLEQKRDMQKKMERLMKKVEEIERGEKEKENNNWRTFEEKMKRWERGAEEQRKEKNGGEAVASRLRELERKWERKEKEERRKNIIIKGIKVKREAMKERAEEIMKQIGVQDAIEEVKPVGYTEGGREVNMVQLRLRSLEHKRIVMMKKKALRGGEERIEEDLTWKERRIQWKIRKIAKEEREKGRNVWVDYGKIRIEGKWWRWDEETETLKDGGGKEWHGKQGEASKTGEEN
ncbi:uncharacterized protein PF11_0207-like [Osmia bicornis bicornis]|uniref:uncharacterized protein PF11_0207-like n=1 Tax=Osmia bicornis bicornis TaxID=1437191 RepID=UPI001EAEB47E|nr:uncharacterized protein PF11_0207-like [Osmia bicornis bicornis]